MYSTVSVEEIQLIDRIQKLQYLHPYVLKSFGYTHERMAVELDLSVGQIIRYNPYSKSKTKCDPPLSICKLTWFLVEKILRDDIVPKIPSLFDYYLSLSLDRN